MRKVWWGLCLIWAAAPLSLGGLPTPLFCDDPTFCRGCSYSAADPFERIAAMSPPGCQRACAESPECMRWELRLDRCSLFPPSSPTNRTACEPSERSTCFCGERREQVVALGCRDDARSADSLKVRGDARLLLGSPGTRALAPNDHGFGLERLPPAARIAGGRPFSGPGPLGLPTLLIDPTTAQSGDFVYEWRTSDRALSRGLRGPVGTAPSRRLPGERVGRQRSARVPWRTFREWPCAHVQLVVAHMSRRPSRDWK